MGCRRHSCFNSRSREGSDSPFRPFRATRDGFNSRSREGSDANGDSVYPETRSFNSRSREGSDQSRLFALLTPAGFNSRSREGSDILMPIQRITGTFQFALPRGERRAPPTRPPSAASFQFALPRGERPAAMRIWFGGDDVSIRAPARGATLTDLSRSGLGVVSIRAPARGATMRPGYARGCGCGFNSRSREGSDTQSARFHNAGLWFQFALPRGERRRNASIFSWIACFNSRSREGSDP